MTNYKDNDPRGWCGNPSRGAAMGRPVIHDANSSFTGKIYLKCVRMSADGAYDSNGTYFGNGAPLYWYASDCGQIDAVLRATNRTDARQKVLVFYPMAKIKK